MVDYACDESFALSHATSIITVLGIFYRCIAFKHCSEVDSWLLDEGGVCRGPKGLRDYIRSPLRSGNEMS